MFTCPNCKKVFDRLQFLLHKTGPCSEIECDSDESLDDWDADPLYSPSKSDPSEEESDNQSDIVCPSSPLTSDQMRVADEVDALLTNTCSGRVDELEKKIHSGNGKEAPDFFVAGSMESLCSQEETVEASHKKDQLENSENSELVVGRCKTSEKRVWDKRDCCIFCDMLVTNFTRHMTRNHAEQLEVGKILSCPKGSKERRVLFERLRKKGNFYHNKNCLRENSGSIIVVQRPKTNHSVSKYLPCKMCLGFFSQESLYRHMQKCKLKTPEDSSKNARSFGSALLIVTPDGFGDLKTNIFPTMRADGITKAVQEDSLICEFGARMLQHHKDQHMKVVISQKMRELGRLKLELKTKITNPKKSSEKGTSCQLEDYIHHDLYKQIVMCVHSLAGYDHQSGKFKIPSLAKKLGFSLKTCSEIVECKGIMLSNENLVLRGKRFAKLLDKMWKFDVSLNASNTLNRAKWNKPKMLPLAEDLKCLHEYLITKEKSLIISIQLKPSELEWRELAEITLMRIILLNRRRSGEAQRIKVSEFQAISNLSVHSDTTQLLTETEKTLCKSFTRFEIKGKGGRPVPVLLTTEMRKIVDLLISTRAKVNVVPSNPYLFAIPKTKLSCLRGSDVLRRHAGLCGAKIPENIKSTLLRKHVATMSQLLNLSGNEIESLATFMGHSVDVHKEYYRLPDDVTQMAKISKLLLALESGKIKELKGHNFDNISVSDCESEDDEEITTSGTLQTSNTLATDGNLHPDVNYKRESSKPAKSTVKLDDMPKELSVTMLNSDDMPVDPSVTMSNSDVKISRKKRRATSVKRPWSVMEKEALVKHFKKHIMIKKVPNKEECVKCIEKETCLSERSWSHLKFQVKNMFGKL